MLLALMFQPSEKSKTAKVSLLKRIGIMASNLSRAGRPNSVPTIFAKERKIPICDRTHIQSLQGEAIPLSAFNLLQKPIWIYDIERLQMWWANPAAVSLWQASSLDELLSRDFSDVSESTRARLRRYSDQLQQGNTLSEQWTFYPKGQPVSVHCHCTGVRIDGDRFAMLVEGSRSVADSRDIRDRIQLETDLTIQQAFLRQIIDTVPSSIFVKDRDGRIIVVNQASAIIHGSSVEAMLNRREPDFNPNFTNEQLEKFLASNQSVMNSRQPQREIQEITTADGEKRWYQTVIRPFVDANDQVQGIIGNSVDITDLKNAEAALQESEARYRSVVTALAEGIVLHHADGQITACNESAERILGITADQMMGRTSLDVRWRTIHENGSPFPGDTHPAMVTLRTGQPQFNVVMGVFKPDGSLTWISINSQPLFHVDETQPYAVVTSFADITLYKQAQHRLEQLAKLDGLTQLANRRFFDQQLVQDWKQLQREQQPLSVLLLDVDYFKLYNDTYGHQAGDDCLRQVATAMQQVAKRPTDLVARYGGEEFVILLPNTNQEGAVWVAQMIQSQVQQLNMEHKQSSISDRVTVSIGIATVVPQRYSAPETVIAIADQALYAAKTEGRNTYRVG